MNESSLGIDSSLSPSEADRLDPVCSEFEAAWREGRRPRIEDFLARVAESDRAKLLRELLALEVHHRRSLGETPRLDDYRGRFADRDSTWLADALAPGRAVVPVDPTRPSETPQVGTTPHAADADADVPAIPGYEVLGWLGRGGMGVVYRARDTRLRREVAVKVLAGRLADDPQAVRRFLEEAHIAGQLQHPGIAAVHELGQLADGRPFLAMKLVKGQTLVERLERRGGPPADLPGLVQVFAQVCQAVAYAHSHGVIHRDLKPGNVMVGGFGEVQVMDWGLAKVLGGALSAAGGRADEPALTAIDTPREGGPSWQTQGALGTYAYMAPEQARGQTERVGARSDVFSLGALLCEVLTGQAPYTGGREGVRRQAEDADLQSALERLEGCGADSSLVELAHACLAARPEGRPADAGAVAQAVAAHLAAVQEQLRRAELARAAEAARAEEAQARAAAEAARAEEARDRADAEAARAEEAQAKVVAERRARRLRLWVGAAALAALALAGGGGWLWQRRQAERHGDVEAALQTAAGHRDGFRWDEAERSLAYARWRLGEGGPADLRQTLTRADADLELAKELDDIRLKKATLVEHKYYNVAAASGRYEEAFRRAGLGSPGEDAEGVASRVRDSAIRDHLLAALDDWAADTENQGRLAWLLEVTRRADDPGRARFRDPEAWASLPAFRRLAEEAVGADIPPALFAAMALRLGDSPVNLTLLRATVARNPTDFYAHFLLANALYKAKAPKEAVGFYWAALAVRPQNATAHYNLGNALRDSGDLKGAIAAHRRAIACVPKLSPAHYNLGLALYSARDLAGAVAAWHKAVECDPKHAQAHYGLGFALLQSGRFAEATSSTRRSIKLLPEGDRLYALASQQLQQCERLLALDQSLSAVLEGKRKPANAAELLALGDLCARYKRRYAAAAHFYADAFAARPSVADDLRQHHRYNAACAAARAAAGDGSAADTLGEHERRCWRAQASVWLRADLAARSKQLKSWWPGEANQSRQALAQWQKDPGLSSVREPAALAWLPLAEALAWSELWADVASQLRPAQKAAK